MSEAIVIGAGIAGIASSIRLAVKGYHVQVFEAASGPGGKLSEFTEDGFRFDTGPSLFTMPQYVNDLFLLAGKNPEAYFNFEKLDTICHYFYEDGTRINAFADRDKFAKEIASKTSDSADSVHHFLEKSKTIYEITNPVFLEKSLHKLSSFLNSGTLKSVLSFHKIDAFRSMNKAIESNFKDSKTIRFFNRYATYNGSNPYKAPATLNVIPHLEQHFGAFFPVGGMYAIVSSLVKLAMDMGVVFHYNSYVDEILVENDQISGIKAAGNIHTANIVVSNMDVWYTYQKLLKRYKIPERILKQERSSSALIFYWGINKSFSELGLHNIFFSEDYREEFRKIWDEKSVSNDPTIYINITSKCKPDDAPEGGENWFTMINVPANTGQDWDLLIKEARQNILDKLSRNLGVEIEPLIVCESVLDPGKIDSGTYSYQGSLYGSSSNSQFSAFLRHANFSSRIEGLYFAGGSVHPGGGIPLALLSAKIVSDLIGE